jgi:4-hydroxymandelate synthase
MADQEISFDALEFWVQDLDKTRRVLTDGFGFEPIDLPPTGQPGSAMALLASGQAAILLRQGLTSASPVTRHVARHGDTIGDVALVCPDVDAILGRAADLGLAVSWLAGGPLVDLLGDGTVCHTVREVGIAPRPGSVAGPAGIRAVDHVAYCLPYGGIEPLARKYEQVFGLRRHDVGAAAEVGDGPDGMRSLVLRSGAGFTVVLTEPTSPGGAGQTQRFLDAHAGPGAQHVALAYADLVAAVRSLRARGVEFLPVPGGYFQAAQRRLQGVAMPVSWDSLRRLEILVDAEGGGLLLQLFTRPVTDRGTFFFEFIQRLGADGFGTNNVRALFEAVRATMTTDDARS